MRNKVDSSGDKNLRTDPLRVQFLLTSLPVGGAEVLLLNLIRNMDRQSFLPEVVCLKQPGEMGEEFAREVPLHANLIHGKFDFWVLNRLRSLFLARKTDAVVTVGAGDKMFWGRAAARLARVPVVCSALHSTGWPDGVGRLNRALTPITSAFIACASRHAEHLIEYERFPRGKVFAIPNGVDTTRFSPEPKARGWLRKELAVPSDAKIVGIVAALRGEKNHAQLLDAAKILASKHDNLHFVIVGDGPEAGSIRSMIDSLGLSQSVHMLGNRSDTERILAGLDVFCLTSKNEANPVSILEALACGIPVVAPDVGSICETVINGRTGFLTEPLSASATADCLSELIASPEIAEHYGHEGRKLVESGYSLSAMVDGYQDLIERLYNQAAQQRDLPRWVGPSSDVEQQTQHPELATV